jgi:chromosomal replication initiator protein
MEGIQKPLQLDLLGGIEDFTPKKPKRPRRRAVARTQIILPEISGDRPSPKMLFSNALIGSSNKTVFEAMELSCGKLFNDQSFVFIVGSHGIGKTHLLNAIANELKGQKKYLLVSGRELLSKFKLYEKEGDEERFYLSLCENYDVLLIDDFISDLVGSSWDHFVSDLIDSFSRKNKTIIMTADKPVHAQTNISGQTQARLMKGCVLKFGKLDQKQALLLTENLCAEMKLGISERLKEFLSISFNHHIHALECAVLTLNNVWQGNIPEDELGEALKILRPLGQIVFRDEKVDLLVKQSASLHGVEPLEVFGSSRNKNVVEARHEVMKKIHSKLGYSSLKIARIFGKDHSSVLYALSKKTKRKSSTANINVKTDSYARGRL